MELGDIAEGKINVKVLSSGRRAVVVRRGDDIKVYDELCPHMGGDLTEAVYCGDKGTLACYWHGYEFDVDDGTLCENPNARLMAKLRAPTKHFQPDRAPSYRLRAIPSRVEGSTLYFGRDTRS